MLEPADGGSPAVYNIPLELGEEHLCNIISEDIQKRVGSGMLQQVSPQDSRENKIWFETDLWQWLQMTRWNLPTVRLYLST